MKAPKVADLPRTSVRMPSPLAFDQEVVAARAWRHTFAALYRSRVRCEPEHAQAIARLVQPSLGTLDALVAVQTVLHEPQLTQALNEAIEKGEVEKGELGDSD